MAVGKGSMARASKAAGKKADSKAVVAEAVSQRRIDVHGLKSRLSPLRIGLDLKGSHIVQTVTKLNKDHSNVLRHSKKHLTDILYMSLFLILNIQLYQLGKTVNQHGDLFSESLFDLTEIGLIGTVLYRIV